jgi:hypothetical protein
MTKPTLAPEPEECPQKRVLVDAIKAAISEMLKLHTDELRAV